MAVRRPIGPAAQRLEARTLFAVAPAPSPATETTATISVVIDYSLDANHFFDTQQKRDLLQQAVDGVTKWFRDALLPLNPGGGDDWEAVFDNPATGQRQTLPTEDGDLAVTVQLSGAVAITTGAGLSRGFRGEVIGFDDGAGLVAGRVVWTDERGDRIFSALNGEGLAAAGRQMRGTIVGGTGRYAGMTGEYEFRWHYLIAAEGSVVNGRAVDLRGRVRLGGGR